MVHVPGVRVTPTNTSEVTMVAVMSGAKQVLMDTFDADAALDLAVTESATVLHGFEAHWLDLLRATFPAGTLSGAPKVRAMEIIDELENLRRGPYGGCIGYVDHFGNMDMAITIRTLLAQDERLYLQAGGGIVADSDPEAEYQEAISKARALIQAIDFAREGAD